MNETTKIQVGAFIKWSNGFCGAGQGAVTSVREDGALLAGGMVVQPEAVTFVGGDEMPEVDDEREAERDACTHPASQCILGRGMLICTVCSQIIGSTPQATS